MNESSYGVSPDFEQRKIRTSFRIIKVKLPFSPVFCKVAVTFTPDSEPEFLTRSKFFDAKSEFFFVQNPDEKAGLIP